MPTFTCCGIGFDSEEAFVEHQQQIHGQRLTIRHTCCGMSFYTDQGYAEHRQTIHGDTAATAGGLRGLLGRLLRR